MSMSNSVEGRYPFLDHNFVEYASKLPRSFKLALLRDKKILRDAMKTYLPEKIYNRSKVAYQSPETRPFIRLDKSYSILIDDYLNRKSLNNIGMFDHRKVNRLLTKIKNSRLPR